MLCRYNVYLGHLTCFHTSIGYLIFIKESQHQFFGPSWSACLLYSSEYINIDRKFTRSQVFGFNNSEQGSWEKPNKITSLLRCSIWLFVICLLFSWCLALSFQAILSNSFWSWLYCNSFQATRLILFDTLTLVGLINRNSTYALGGIGPNLTSLIIGLNFQSLPCFSFSFFSSFPLLFFLLLYSNHIFCPLA